MQNFVLYGFEGRINSYAPMNGKIYINVVYVENKNIYVCYKVYFNNLIHESYKCIFC